MQNMKMNNINAYLFNMLGLLSNLEHCSSILNMIAKLYLMKP